MNTATATRPFQGNFDGPMSQGELTFCQWVRALIDASLRGRTPFVVVITSLLQDVRELRQHRYDVDAALAEGVEFQISKAELRDAHPDGSYTLTSKEKEFLLDLDGFLDFSVRNGLLFRAPLGIISHDVSEIAQNDFDLEKALERFTPKAEGWAQLNAEPVGEVQQVTE